MDINRFKYFTNEEILIINTSLEEMKKNKNSWGRNYFRMHDMIFDIEILIKETDKIVMNACEIKEDFYEE